MSFLTPDLLTRFDVPGPRYTSYPTADRFVEAFTTADYIQALELRRDAISARTKPLSLYVHIPFCESLCYYCACNKIITKHPERATAYLDYLTREVALHVAHLGVDQSVSQLHLGGGTPTFLKDAELVFLMDMLKRNFRLVPQAEVETRPRLSSGVLSWTRVLRMNTETESAAPSSASIASDKGKLVDRPKIRVARP